MSNLLALDAENAKQDEELEKINDKKSQESRIRAKTERVCLVAEATGTIAGKRKNTVVTDKKKTPQLKQISVCKSLPVIASV